MMISERTKIQKTTHFDSIDLNFRKDKIYGGKNQMSSCGGRERGVPAKEHLGVFCSDENVLCLDCGGDCSICIYRDTCIYQKSSNCSLKIDKFS